MAPAALTSTDGPIVRHYTPACWLGGLLGTVLFLAAASLGVLAAAVLLPPCAGPVGAWC